MKLAQAIFAILSFVFAFVLTSLCLLTISAIPGFVGVTVAALVFGLGYVSGLVLSAIFRPTTIRVIDLDRVKKSHPAKD